MASIQELEKKILELESRLTEKNELFERLSMESRRAVDLALHAYRVDHYGYIWVYNPDDKLYHKSNMRVCTPEIADKAIQTRHLVSKCITSEKIADKAVTRDKLDDQVINDIRMLDLGDLFLGDYYTKEEVDGKLGGLDVDVDLTGYATEQWVQQQAYLKAEALTDFYQKSEAYSKNDVDQIVNTIKTGRFKSVQTLPEVSEAERNVIYLIPSSGGTSQNGEGTTGNVKDEFIVIEGDNGTLAWEQIGSTAIDLTGYVQKDDLKIERVEGRNDVVDIILDNDNDKTARVYVKYYDRNDGLEGDGLDINDFNAPTREKFNNIQQKVTPVGNGIIKDTVAIYNKDGFVTESGVLLSDLARKVAVNENNAEILILSSDGGYEPSGLVLGNLVSVLKDLSIDINKGDANLVDITISNLADGEDGKTVLGNPVTKTLATDDYVNAKTSGIPTSENVAGKADKISGGTENRIVLVGAADNQGRRNIKQSDKTLDDVIIKSNTAGLLKNDGTVDTTEYAKKSEIPSLDGYAKMEDIPSAPDLSPYALKSEIPDVSGKADKMAIVAASGSALTAEVNKYYRFDSEVSTLTVTLPTVGETGKIQSLIVSLKTGSGTPSVSFVSADQNVQVLFFEGLSIDPGTSYEFNCMWNGKNWIVAYGVVA